MTLWHTIRWLLSLVGSTALSLGFAQLALSQTSAETNRGGAYAPQGIALRNTTLAAAEARALNAGPIHEAFLEPLSTNVEPSIVVRNEPPQPIDETPPAYRPEAANLEWIPGYWMWLEQQNDFVWVSGLWRAVPPGRTWTPGHWATIDDGYGWINGFWSDGNTPELQYLPYPPESLEQESRSEAPDANHFWIPGCWQWEGEQDQYAWRPGHWYLGQSNWLWVPHHYVYTPRGAVLVRGYWDYPIERRGLLYAPVYWNGGYHYGAGYSYTPNRVINTALLLGSLFVDNNHGNYYYGNRYAGHNNYAPWYATGRSRNGYDSPMQGYYSWQYGHDRNDWRARFDGSDQRRRDDFHNRRDRRDRDAYPQIVGTVDDLRRFHADGQRRNPDGDRDQRGAERRPGNQFRKLTGDEQRRAIERSLQLQQYREARAKFESQHRRGDRDRLTQSIDASRDQRNRDPTNPTRNFRPSTLRLQSAAQVEALRRQSRERYQQYQQQVMRQRLDGPDRGGNQRVPRDFDRNRSALSQGLQRQPSRDRRQPGNAREPQAEQTNRQRSDRQRSARESQRSRQRADDARSNSNGNARRQSAKRTQGNRGPSSDARGNSRGGDNRASRNKSGRGEKDREVKKSSGGKKGKE